MKVFAIADMHVSPGTLELGSLMLGETRGGMAISMPLLVLNGKAEGPKLWIDSCVHGNEIGGIEVIRRIIREEIAPTDLAGTIVGAPVLNPFAFQAGVHGTAPVYATTGANKDLNAAFPGNPNGTLNERIANRILTEGIATCDYVMSFHSNYYPAVEFSIVTRHQNSEMLEASLALAKAFGLPIGERSIPKGGYLIYSTQEAGKPSMMVEIVAQGYFDDSSIRLAVLGVKNVLKHLGMIKGEVEPLPGLKIPPGMYGRGFIRCNHGGVAHFQKRAGDWIERGDVVAVIRDLYGDVVEEVKAETPGYIRTIMFGPHNEAVHEGDGIASVLESDPRRRYFHD
jgi:predicted deacylase